MIESYNEDRDLITRCFACFCCIYTVRKSKKQIKHYPSSSDPKEHEKRPVLLHNTILDNTTYNYMNYNTPKQLDTKTIHVKSKDSYTPRDDIFDCKSLTNRISIIEDTITQDDTSDTASVKQRKYSHTIIEPLQISRQRRYSHVYTDEDAHITRIHTIAKDIQETDKLCIHNLSTHKLTRVDTCRSSNIRYSQSNIKAYTENHSDNSGFEATMTIVYLDWDDTILPSEFIREFKSTPEEINRYRYLLQDISKTTIKLLDKIKDLSTPDNVIETHIVTLADEGWIEYSGETYLPDVYRYIRNNSIQLYYAKKKKYFIKDYKPFGLPNVDTYDITKYQSNDLTKKHNQEYIKYVKNKYDTFVHILNLPTITEYFNRVHLVSIGDSKIEYTAIKLLHQIVGIVNVNSIYKSIQFKERPQIDDIHNQLNKLLQCIGNVVRDVEKSYDLDINM